MVTLASEPNNEVTYEVPCLFYDSDVHIARQVLVFLVILGSLSPKNPSWFYTVRGKYEEKARILSRAWKIVADLSLG